MSKISFDENFVQLSPYSETITVIARIPFDPFHVMPYLSKHQL